MKKLMVLIIGGILLMQLCTFAKAESVEDIPVEKGDILCESVDFMELQYNQVMVIIHRLM